MNGMYSILFLNLILITDYLYELLGNSLTALMQYRPQ